MFCPAESGTGPGGFVSVSTWEMTPGELQLKTKDAKAGGTAKPKARTHANPPTNQGTTDLPVLRNMFASSMVACRSVRLPCLNVPLVSAYPMPDIAEICRNNRNETWLRNWYGWETGVARNSSRGIPRAPTRSFREGRTARGERQAGPSWPCPPDFRSGEKLRRGRRFSFQAGQRQYARGEEPGGAGDRGRNGVRG